MNRVTIDGTKIAGLPHLHTVLARELGFPKCYGANLDALYDCLGALCEETVLTVRHSEALVEALGRRAKGFFKVLKDAQKANPKLTVCAE